MSPPVKWLLGVLAVAATLSAHPALAAPADESLRLVPPETAICFVVRDLRAHARAVAESPFATWVESSGLLQPLVDSTEVSKLKQLSAVMALQFGVTPDQLRDDVLGDAVVFAYQPGPPGRPDEESGLVLVRPRKPDVLAGLVAKVNDLQRTSGELRAIREKSHRGQTYYEREQAGGGREFYVTAGNVFAYSKQEAAILAVIDRGRGAGDDAGPVAAGLRRLGLSDTFAACWFNPRGFDALLGTQAAATTKPGERAFLDQFRKLWSATDGLALFAHPGRGVEFGLVASLDESRLPAELLPLLFPPDGNSHLWSVFPDDAILAVGGRLDVPKVLAAVGAFLPPDGKDGLKAAVEQGLGPLVGKDKLPAVLAGLGPEWAAWVTPPVGSDAGWVPGWTFALKLGTAEPRTADVARPELQALDFAAQMARFAYNRDHADQIELGEERQGAVTVKYLANPKGFPAGLRPAYAVKQGYLVVASSPEAVGRFAAPGAGAAAAAPLLRLSARHFRAYLENHRKPLAAALAKPGDKTPEAVEKELNQLGRFLEAIERVEVRYEGAGGRARLSIHVDLVRPLAK